MTRSCVRIVAGRSQFGIDPVSIASPILVDALVTMPITMLAPVRRVRIADDGTCEHTGRMASWGSYSSFYGPLVAIAAIAVLVLLLRWTFGRGHSLVSRPARRGAENEYGLLVAVAAPSTFVEAELIRARLVAAGLRATLAPTTTGPRVMVFPNEEKVARALLRDPM